MHILITGGCGYTGTLLTNNLVDLGYMKLSKKSMIALGKTVILYLSFGKISKSKMWLKQKKKISKTDY